MDNFVHNVSYLMDKIAFSPVILIGLLIASLSLILNLKSTNLYIQKFKKHKNVDKFINLIFYTSFNLLLMFILFIISKIIHNNSFQIIISIIYTVMLVYLIYSLFTIVFILKEIVRTSLKEK